MSGGQEIAGSNPAIPTTLKNPDSAMNLDFCYLTFDKITDWYKP
ncbi:protein of unknown function [Shewanella benthica]|uniref:Uncharacterized protein n=1 Tax=Shewanella benthica TaxID=43661 RepID=A0A330M112_9GAMM|nr:protein of unknown function [Shewanella benthica]